MKNIIKLLLSDSNKISVKRFIGLISLILFIAYGIRGLLLKPFDVNFAIFFVSLCSVTIWIAFKFMSADKALKYNVLGTLTKFSGKTANEIESVIEGEAEDFPLK